MGYTHSWYRPETIEPEIFKAIVRDTKIVLAELESQKLPLADGCGNGRPELTDDVICFNGAKACGHQADASICIPWPTQDAAGVNASTKVGGWFAGVTIDTRRCGGDCSYEAFRISRVADILDYKRNNASKRDGLFFEFCKTAYRPFDLAVTAVLIVAKHHLRDRFRVCSDGEAPQWVDGAMVCQGMLSYGADFTLDREE